MSLEHAIQLQTEALNRNNALLEQLLKLQGAPAPAAPAEPKPEPETPAEEPIPEAAQAPAENVVTLEQVRAKLTQLAKRDKSKARAIVARFGVEKLPDVPAEKLPELLKLCEAELAA